MFSPLDDEKQESEPLYDGYTSQSESDEEGYNVLGAFESQVGFQSVAFLDNTDLIFDMIDKEHRKVVVSSFQNDPETKGSAQEQLKVKEESPLSPPSHQEVHTHVFQATFHSGGRKMVRPSPFPARLMLKIRM